jgi:hypothetical protein
MYEVSEDISTLIEVERTDKDKQERLRKTERQAR